MRFDFALRALREALLVTRMLKSADYGSIETVHGGKIDEMAMSRLQG